MRITQNESTSAKRRVGFYCVSDADGVSPMTGLTFGTVTDLKVNKAFGGEANFAGSAVEVTSTPGYYYYQFSAGEVDTLGALTLRLNITGVRSKMYQHQVV